MNLLQTVKLAGEPAAAGGIHHQQGLACRQFTQVDRILGVKPAQVVIQKCRTTGGQGRRGQKHGGNGKNADQGSHGHISIRHFINV